MFDHYRPYLLVNAIIFLKIYDYTDMHQAGH